MSYSKTGYKGMDKCFHARKYLTFYASAIHRFYPLQNKMAMMALSHSHTMTPYDASRKRAF